MSLASLDLALERHANLVAVRHDGLEDAMSAYAGISQPLFMAIVATILVVAAVRRDRDGAVLGALTLAATGSALLVAKVISLAVDRPRPFVAHHDVHAFVAHAADPGFPSDHATAGFAIAVALLLLGGRRWWPVLAAAILLAVSRVLLGLHYPGDVLAGAAVGVAAAFVTSAVRSRIALLAPQPAQP